MYAAVQNASETEWNSIRIPNVKGISIEFRITLFVMPGKSYLLESLCCICLLEEQELVLEVHQK